MNFYTFDFGFEQKMFFLDLNYTTDADGKTWHWLLCLNTGTKQQFTQATKNRLEPIEFSDIPQTLENK